MADPLIGPVREPALHVMTFNLRGPHDPPPHDWTTRAPAVVELLRRERPSVIGTQEGRWPHIRLLARELRESYDWVGLGRQGGSRSEFAAVFYEVERLEPVAFDHLWLSSLPRLTGSRTWGNWMHPRMLTWVALRDRTDGRVFAVINTHLDHRSAHARRRSALALRRLAGRMPWPVLLTGDFNADDGSEPHRLLTTGPTALRDTWTEAGATGGTTSLRTWNGWEAPCAGDRIDWILADDHWSVERAAVNTGLPDGVHPSDHWPVQAVVRPRADTTPGCQGRPRPRWSRRYEH